MTGLVKGSYTYTQASFNAWSHSYTMMVISAFTVGGGWSYGINS